MNKRKHGKQRLGVSERMAIKVLIRQHKAYALPVRSANVVLALDDEHPPQLVAEIFYLDPDTVRRWRCAFEKKRMASLDLAEYPEREGHLTAAQEAEAHFRAHPLRDTNRAWLWETFEIENSRSGAIKLMHRLGFEWNKPKRLPKQADLASQKAFIADYKRLMDGLSPDEKVIFVDAVHPECQSRPAHGWFYKADRPAVLTTTGRQRVNIHGALDLEEMRLVRVAGERINAETTLALFKSTEEASPDTRIFHLFSGNARYHHAKMLKPWLERPECRLKLHFLPSYAPHLNPIELLWGVMHHQVTHNRSHANFRQFTDAIDAFFDEMLPQMQEMFRSMVTDNFRVITHDGHRLIG